jgi:four helix bundle protein
MRYFHVLLRYIKDRGRKLRTVARNNIVLEKSRKFAVRIFNLYKFLCDEKREYVLAKQLLRSGTSVGANLSEAKYSISKKEYLYKSLIALKECAETEYWLDLLKDTGVLTTDEYNSMITDCRDILYLLISRTKTIKQDLKGRREEGGGEKTASL